MRRVAAFFALMGAAFGATAAPNVLSYTNHVATSVNTAVAALLGGGIVDSAIYVDYANSSWTVGVINDALSGSTADAYSAATGTLVNPGGAAGTHNRAPYGVATVSYSGWSTSYEATVYPTATAAGLILNYAYVPLSPEGSTSMPPASEMSTVMRYDQAGGYGVEFTISASYGATWGLDVGSPSGTTASFAGMLAAMKYNHPAWTWGDIKGAFRQTAVNWSSGYNHTTGGYGAVNFQTATAIANTSAIWLQPPSVSFASHGYYASISIYPFKTTRRDHEVVYSVSAGGVWPAPSNGSEYTPSEFTAALASAGGGTLLYSTAAGSSATTYNYSPGTAGTLTFMVFTVDSSGNVSRKEEFMTQSVGFINPAITCTQR